MATRRRRAGEGHEAKFLNRGLDFKAKVVGNTLVPAARGEKMCHDALRSLKDKLKTSGKHKLRVVINVAMDGIKIKDEKSQEVLNTFHIHRISFISHDPDDSRVFALIDGVKGDPGYTLHAYKSEKTAGAVTGAIKELFQIVYKYRREMKRQEMEKETNKAAANGGANDAKHVDSIAGNNVSEDKLATAGSHTQKNEIGEDWYQVPKQILGQKNTEDLYQVPSNVPATQANTATESNTAAVFQDWLNLSAGLNQIATDLSLDPGAGMFPPSDVFGSDPFASFAKNDDFAVTTPTLSETDPFSPIKKDPPSSLMNSALQSNGFLSSEVSKFSNATPGQGFDPFKMESSAASADLFSNSDSFLQTANQSDGSQFQQAVSKPLGGPATFGDSFVGPLATQNQTIPTALSPVFSDPFGVQQSTQKGWSGGGEAAKHVAPQENSMGLDPFASGSSRFGNSQKLEVSADDRFAALRMLDDESSSGSMFLTSPTALGTSTVSSQFSDPFEVFGSPAVTQSKTQNSTAVGNSVTPSNTTSTTADLFAILSNVPTDKSSKSQAVDPFTNVATKFSSGLTLSDPFQTESSKSAADPFQPEKANDPFHNKGTGTFEIGLVSGIAPLTAATSFMPATTSTTSKDLFETFQSSNTSSSPGAVDHFAAFNPQSTMSTVSAPTIPVNSLQQPPLGTQMNTSVGPFGSSATGDLFSNVSILGLGIVDSKHDPFLPLGTSQHPTTSDFQSTFTDPFSSFTAPKSQSNFGLSGSKSTGAITTQAAVSSTNPFLASNASGGPVSSFNPFADHPSFRMAGEQEQKKQAASNPFVDFSGSSLFEST